MVLSELIKEYKDMSLDEVTVEEVLDDLQELESLYKPKDVPQYVADWYEEHKDNLEYNIWDWMKYNLEPKKRENVIFSRWLGKTTNNPIETLVKMKLYGYTVEKEKRYLVKMKGISSNICYLNRVGNKWIIAGINEHTGMNIYTKHTKKELEEAGFGWIFSCEGIEVEEVEEG